MFPHMIFGEYLIENEIFTLECAKRLLEANGWSAYKAARHAACHGSWFAATFIVGNLIVKVHSHSLHCWLKSLFQFAIAERKIQSLLLADYGSALVDWLEKEKILDPFATEEETSNHDAGSISESVFHDKLFKAYQCLCSSGETLKAAVSSDQAFLFQRWFLSLRTKALGIVVSIFKLLGNLSYCTSSDCIELGTDDMVAIHETSKEFSKLSSNLERLSREFDLIVTSLIGMDAKSSNIVSAIALNCSLLAFCTGFAFHFWNLPATIVAENPEDFKTDLHAVLIQNLTSRLWSVDREMSLKLIQLFEVIGEPKNFSHCLSRTQASDPGYEVRDMMALCSFAISEVISLQSKLNRSNDRTVFRVIEEGKQLLSNILMHWISIPFRTPKCFFRVRPWIGSELFATANAGKPDKISVQCGFHLSLNVCLQLRNIPTDMPFHIAKLYCILCCGLSFKDPGPTGENKEQKQQGYEAWENDGILEMHNKLLCHVTECTENERNIGKCGTSSPCSIDGLVQAFVHFEPNQKGQGFSNCLLDVSCLPVGGYRIKWYSCCVDKEGSLWSLLPLNSGPLFSIHDLG